MEEDIKNNIVISTKTYRLDNDDISVWFDLEDGLMIYSKTGNKEIDLIKNGNFIIESINKIKNILNDRTNTRLHTRRFD